MVAASVARELSTFGPERLALVTDLERWHFWFAGRRALLDQLWRRHAGSSHQRVLEVGCGSGRFAAAMARAGHRVVGIADFSATPAWLRKRALTAAECQVTQCPRPR